MSMIPWKHKRREDAEGRLAPMHELRYELERWFDTFFHEPFVDFDDSLQAWNPALDVVETDRDVTIRAEVPGVDPKDLDVSVSENQLLIAGEKREHSEEKQGSFYRAERRFGSFRRSVPLPAGVDAENVNAEYANGVVTIRLAKTPEAATRRIPIKGV